MGRKAAATAYNYSKSMKNSGIVWTEKHLFAYITNPGRHIPGNKMAYPGMADPEGKLT